MADLKSDIYNNTILLSDVSNGLVLASCRIPVTVYIISLTNKGIIKPVLRNNEQYYRLMLSSD